MLLTSLVIIGRYLRYFLVVDDFPRFSVEMHCGVAEELLDVCWLGAAYMYAGEDGSGGGGALTVGGVECGGGGQDGGGYSYTSCVRASKLHCGSVDVDAAAEAKFRPRPGLRREMTGDGAPELISSVSVCAPDSPSHTRHCLGLSEKPYPRASGSASLPRSCPPLCLCLSTSHAMPCHRDHRSSRLAIERVDDDDAKRELG